MTYDPNQPDVLLSVSTEIEATAIATALGEYDVQALTVGGYTSGFQAEAPGAVAVIVKRVDFDRAKQALVEIQQQRGQIDWSKVDVMEGVETPAANGVADAPKKFRIISHHVWWVLEFLGIAICILVWLFTEELTPGLIYFITALAIIGISLAMFPFARRGR